MEQENTGMVTVLEPVTAENTVMPPAPRQLPWAGIATGSANEGELMTSEQMLERAGLNWEVGIRPYQRLVRPAHFEDNVLVTPPEYAPSKKMHETYRLDTGDELGAVRSRYELLQNREAFDFGDSLVTGHKGRWVTAGEQNGGSRVFMTMLLDEEFQVLDDTFVTYMFFSTSHDGSRAVSAYITPVRVFCTNQTGIVRQNNFGKFVVQHTPSMQGKLASAAESIMLAGEYSTLLKAEAAKLVAVQVDEDKARSLLTSVIPSRRARKDEMVEEIIAHTKSSPTVAGYEGTGWGWLNGLTEYMDHVKPQRNGNARFESITFGEGAKFRTEMAAKLAAMN